MKIFSFKTIFFHRRIDILPEDCTEEKKKQLKYAYEVSNFVTMLFINFSFFAQQIIKKKTVQVTCDITVGFITEINIFNHFTDYIHNDVATFSCRRWFEPGIYKQSLDFFQCPLNLPRLPYFALIILWYQQIKKLWY